MGSTTALTESFVYSMPHPKTRQPIPTQFEQFIPPGAIARRNHELAEAYIEHYGQVELDEPVVALAVLNGGLPFAWNFIQSIIDIEPAAEPEFASVQYESYTTTGTSSGMIRPRKKVEISLEGRHVIADDILDTGNTLRYAAKTVAQSAASVAIAVMLQRPKGIQSLQSYGLQVNYAGFTIESGFVAGYGMGLGRNNRYRGLRGIYAPVGNGHPDPKYTQGDIRPPVLAT